MSAIQVKTYLIPDNKKISLSSVADVDEIRRFTLNPENNGKNYEKLIEKIKQAYGSLVPSNSKNIRTYWQDDENELIGFSSDNELEYAIDVTTALKLSKPYETSVIFKVYVARKAHRENKEQSEAPADSSLPIHFGVVCDNCDGSVIGNRYKCSVCPDFDLCEECKKKNVHKEHSMNTIERPYGQFWSFGPDHRGPRCHRGHRGNRHFNGEKRCNRQNPFEHIMKEFANIPQFAASNVPLVNNPEQLKNFGEQLKKFLDPFGIDVSYYVDSMTKEQKKDDKSAGKSEEKKEENPKKEQDEKKMETDEKKSNQTQEAPLQKEHEKKSSIMDESLEDITEPATTPKQTDSTAQASAPQASLNEQLINLEKSVTAAPFEGLQDALKNISTACEKAATDEDKSSTMVDGFNLVDIEKELKIIKAIEQLKLMGYSDDGGWLTRLVTAKNGNINAVLDAITPSK